MPAEEQEKEKRQRQTRHAALLCRINSFAALTDMRGNKTNERASQIVATFPSPLRLSCSFILRVAVSVHSFGKLTAQTKHKQKAEGEMGDWTGKSNE